MTIQPTTLPTPCYRCTGAPISWQPGHPTDGLCMACRGEVQANRDNARDELAEFIRGDDGTDSGVNPYTGGRMSGVAL